MHEQPNFTLPLAPQEPGLSVALPLEEDLQLEVKEKLAPNFLKELTEHFLIKNFIPEAANFCRFLAMVQQ